MTELLQVPLFLVDDEEDILFSFRVLFRSAGFENLMTIQDSRHVASILEDCPEGVVVLDLNMPHLCGFDLLKEIRRDYPAVQVIVVTAANELEMAVECMKAGAIDYFVKPVEKSRLVASVRRAAETSALDRHVVSLRRHLLDDRLEKWEAFAPILTRDGGMRGVFRYLEAVAGTGKPVLLLGETGTGKELFARAVHDASGRAGKFVAVNVAGLDDHMFCDTLFGHARGAFTGADSRREGLIAQAAAGTLFLDEIGDLKEETQVKLLRLIQEGEYYPLGSDHSQRSAARIVAATNLDLHLRVKQGRFRPDLFYRLCTHQVDIPPLRERRGDLPLLLDVFLEEAAEATGKKRPTPPPELLGYLAAYPFPGNVRELKAMVFDAVARHRGGVLSLDCFRKALGNLSPAPLPCGEEMILLRDPQRIPTIKEAEEFLVARALELARGNQGVAASLLGLTRQGLNKKLNRTKPSSY